MSLEDEIRDHFAQTAQGLPDPPDRFETVVGRGRRRRMVQGSVLGLAAVGLVLSAPTLLGSVLPTRVELAPAASPESAAPTDPVPPSDRADVASEPTGVGPDRVPTGQSMPIEGIGAPVVGYVPGEPGVNVYRDGSVTQVWNGRADHAIADGRGGVLIQARRQLVWVPGADPASAITLVEGDAVPQLRAVGPDGRVRFSVRSQSPDSGEHQEEFFEVELEEGAQPESVGTQGAQESWTVGPAFVAGGETTAVHASCHLLCALRVGEWGGFEEVPAIYDESTTIDGLTSDGRVIAFVERQLHAPDEAMAPTVVLLDTASFEVVARVALPKDPEAQRRWDEGVVVIPEASISPDGQRILVSMGTTYLVEDPMTDRPSIRQIDTSGVLRWLGPRA